MPLDCPLAKSNLSSLKKLQRNFDVLVEELRSNLSDRPTINRVHAEKRKIEKEFHRIVGETRELLFRPGEFFLNVPDLKKMPSQEELEDKEKGYELDSTVAAFPPGRPLSDFALTEDALKEAKITDAVFRSSLIESTTKKKLRVTAKVIDRSKILEEKKKLEPEHPDRLTTKEILEALDAEGYRPANISELLAFAKDHWRPIPDPEKPLTEKEKEALLDSRYVYAFGSFTMYGDLRYVALLRSSSGERFLGHDWFGCELYAGNRFLFVRK